jgi:pimeloyl-ACP methyl ester carboxylesterase
LADLEVVVPNIKERQFLLTNLIRDPVEPTRFKWKINLEGIGRYLKYIIKFYIENGHYSGPTLFIYGEKSDFVREHDFVGIKRVFPNVRFQKVPEAGHWLHADAPEFFADRVVEFLLE